ncbi:MAG: hypothetical protein KTR25_13760 [Myxococcales bacterium]|nr:hypothetical protein [Myxococcales bacterium]
MDLALYRQGEPEALADVIDRYGPMVWALARRGFVCEDAITLGAERTTIRVLGAPSAQVAAQLTERILTNVLQPDQRALAEDEESIERYVLELTRIELFRAGERAARLISLNELEDQQSVPAEIEDLDALLYLGQRPALKALPLEDSERLHIEEGEQITKRFVLSLDPRSQSMVHLRFVVGLDRTAVAKRLDFGITAVALLEDRLRRRIRQQLRTTLNNPYLGNADIDAFLGKTPYRLLPSPVTWDRLSQRVRLRTHREPPASYARRLAWGLGTLAMAAFGGTAIWLGWLPSSDHHNLLPPQIHLRCAPACLPGAEGHLGIRGSQDARRFAVVLRSPNGIVRPLLVAPDGGSLRLPFGARSRMVPVPHPIRLPPDTEPGTEAIVVFSEDKLTEKEVFDVASGIASFPYVTATATTLAVQ